MMMTLTGLCALIMFATPMNPGGGEGKDAKLTKKTEGSVPLAGDKRLEVLSTSELTGPLLRSPFAWIGPVLRARFDRQGEYAYNGKAPISSVGEWGQRMTSDQLLEILRQVGGVDWEVEGVQIESAGNKILLVNDQASIDKVRTAYRRILAATAPRYEIRSMVYEVGPKTEEPALGELDGKVVESLFARLERGETGRILHEGRAMARSGDSIRLGQTTQTSFVGDVQVEIAQKAKAGDPVVIPLDLERSLTLRPLLGPDGEKVALIGMFNSRQVDGGVQSERVVAEGTQNVDQVRVDLRQRVFSMSLADGSGCLMAPGGALQPGLRVLFQIRRLDPKPQELPDLALVPTSLVATSALRARKGADRAPLWLNDVGISSGLLVQYVEMLTSVNNGDSQVMGMPEFLWVKGPAASDARRIARKMAADLARSFVVEIRREIRPLEGESQGWASFGEPIRMHCLGQRLGYAMTGYEQTYVADYTVEVAQESAVGKLQQAACFVGVQAWTAVIPSGKRATVHLDLRDSSLSDWRRVSAPTDVVGDIAIPRIDEVHLLRRLELQPGETRSLGEGARRIVDGMPHRTRITLKLTER